MSVRDQGSVDIMRRLGNAVFMYLLRLRPENGKVPSWNIEPSTILILTYLRLHWYIDLGSSLNLSSIFKPFPKSETMLDAREEGIDMVEARDGS